MMEDVVWSKLFSQKFLETAPHDYATNNFSALVISRHSWHLPSLFEAAWEPPPILADVLRKFELYRKSDDIFNMPTGPNEGCSLLSLDLAIYFQNPLGKLDMFNSNMCWLCPGAKRANNTCVCGRTDISISLTTTVSAAAVLC
jgi:hypothetical protein